MQSNSTNFVVWKKQILIILRSYELEGFFLGDYDCPSRYWMRQDQMTGLWLITCMEGELMKEISKCNTSMEMSTILENLFASQSRAKKFQYKSELSNIWKGSMLVTNYVMRIKDIVVQLFACG